MIRRCRLNDTADIDTLSEMLIRTVDDGASIGFLAPLSQETAHRYWQSVFSSLGPNRCLWVAESAGKIVGTVQLALCEKENGRHRAEVQKLFVDPEARSKGVARQLLTTVEAQAAANALTLLVLDTVAGSPAESVYRHLGWTKVGEIPGYALSPYGKLEATAYFYKESYAN